MSSSEARDELLGRGGRFSHPYEVRLDLDGGTRPILLNEGSGHANMGGRFSLQDILAPAWTEHLELCDCGWLRDVAREEQARTTPFTAEELLQRQPQPRAPRQR